MNARVLELIQRPENISKEDISLLQKEISKYPYMQSIRTLYLSSVFNFDTDNYQKELTKTAAYTTDKKILYTFINKKSEDQKKEASKFKKILLSKPEIKEETQPISAIEQVVSTHQFSEIIATSSTNKTPETFIEKEIYAPKNTIGDTELEVPILDKKENEFEIFTEERELEIPQNSVGDTELETPILEKKENEFEVLREIRDFELENQWVEQQQEIEKKSDVVFKTREEDLNFSKETILDQFDQIAENQKIIPAVKPSEISFNGFDSFLPDVKFTVPSAKKEEPKLEISVPKIEEKTLEVETKNNDVSFENVQNFEISEPMKTETIEAEFKEEILEEKPQEINADILVPKKSDVEEDASTTLSITKEPEVHTEWKPMNFLMNPLDSTLKKAEVSAPKPAEKPIEKQVELVAEKGQEKMDTSTSLNIVEEPKTDILEVDKEERPVLNVSFFGNSVQEIKKDVSTSLNVTEEKTIEIQPETAQSNIPNFVNTWQNWLKIERTETQKSVLEKEVKQEVLPEKIIEKKAEIIEKFIEENPKISQLKEESNFVIKEKNDDISHLMTETLAKLYTEQKLYVKAIKAYEVLQKKHPEKAKEFELKINEIKELKQGK